MSISHRLTSPIAAEIDLSPVVDSTLWLSRIDKLIAGGVMSFNLVANGSVRPVIELISQINNHGAQIALTLPHGTAVSSVDLQELQKCTLRVPVDVTNGPPVELQAVELSLAEANIALVLILEELPPESHWNSWFRWLSEHSVVAINILDANCVTQSEYESFLSHVDIWSMNCNVPVISDLVLLPRYINRPGITPTRCPAGQLAVFISQEGDLRPCRHSSYSFGYLDTGRLSEIWNSEKHEPWTRLPLECESCKFVDCAGGCRARAPSGHKDPLCPGPVSV